MLFIMYQNFYNETFTRGFKKISENFSLMFFFSFEFPLKIFAFKFHFYVQQNKILLIRYLEKKNVIHIIFSTACFKVKSPELLLKIIRNYETRMHVKRTLLNC